MSPVASGSRVTKANLVRRAEECASYPGLERAGHKLARGIAELFEGLMAARAHVALTPVRLEKTPTSEGLAVQRIRLEPLKGTAELIISRVSVMRLVDLYYGGAGTEVLERERLSPTEARFFQRIASAFCALLGAAWQPFVQIRAALDDDAGPTDGPVAIQVFSVTLNGHAPFEIECRFSIPMLEALPGLQSATPATGEELADESWQARLMDCALDVSFPVRAVFAQPELPLARLMNLRAGDVIPVCLPAQIDLIVAGLRFARGSAGESGGRAAVCIEHL